MEDEAGGRLDSQAGAVDGWLAQATLLLKDKILSTTCLNGVQNEGGGDGEDGDGCRERESERRRGDEAR